MTKNKTAYTISLETLTPKLFESLYRSVGWELPCIEQAMRLGGSGNVQNVKIN